MLAPIAIIAGAVALHQKLNAERAVVESDSQQKAGAVDLSFEQNAINDMRHYGAWTPSFRQAPTRVPYSIDEIAYFIHQPGVSHMDAPVERYYRQLTNAISYDSRDFLESFQANYPQFARKANVANYQGFTPEMKLRGDNGEVYSTNFMNFNWLPQDPTDADWEDAGALAKAVPRVPDLFTPQGDFANAPGLDFRYSNY